MKMKRTASILFSLALILTLFSLFPLAPKAAHESATPISADFSDDTLSEGEYRLEADVAYTGTNNLKIPKKVTLCLNGHTLTMPQGLYVDLYSHNSELVLCDCGDHATAGKLIGSVAPDGDTYHPTPLINCSSDSSLTINCGDVENTAPDGIAVLGGGHVGITGGSAITAQGYSLIDRSVCNFYLSDCTLSGTVQINTGCIYAYLDSLDAPYTGNCVEIELNDPDAKKNVGSNSIVQGVNDDNHEKFTLASPVDGYIMVRENGFLKLKKQLDDTNAKGVSVTMTNESGGDATLTVTPLDPSYTFLREPLVTVDGVAATPERQDDGSYTLSMTEQDAKKYITVSSVAGLPLPPERIDTSGLKKARVEAVTHNGKLFFHVIPDVGYTAVSISVTLNGSTIFTEEQNDILMEFANGGESYPDGGVLTVSGTPYEIPIHHVFSANPSDIHASAKAGAGRDVIITIMPLTSKMLLTPPEVLADGVKVPPELIVKQANGNYIATVKNGRDNNNITVSGRTFRLPETNLLFGATLTGEPDDNPGAAKLTITPKAGMEFIEPPTVSAGTTPCTVTEEGDGSYTVVIPSELVDQSITVSGNAGVRLALSGTLNGAEAKAFKLDVITSENLLILITPDAQKTFVTAPVISINGAPIPSALVSAQPSGGYSALLTYFDGDLLTVDGQATATGLPEPSTGALTGATLTQARETDGSVTLTITPEAGKLFATAPTVTVGTSPLSPEKQADGRYTVTIPLSELWKAITVSGTASTPPPPVTEAPKPPATEAPATTAAPITTTAPTTTAAPATTTPATSEPASTGPAVTAPPATDGGAPATEPSGPSPLLIVLIALAGAGAVGGGVLVFLKKRR